MKLQRVLFDEATDSESPKEAGTPRVPGKGWSAFEISTLAPATSANPTSKRASLFWTVSALAASGTVLGITALISCNGDPRRFGSVEWPLFAAVSLATVLVAGGLVFSLARFCRAEQPGAVLPVDLHDVAKSRQRVYTKHIALLWMLTFGLALIATQVILGPVLKKYPAADPCPSPCKVHELKHPTGMPTTGPTLAPTERCGTTLTDRGVAEHETNVDISKKGLTCIDLREVDAREIESLDVSDNALGWVDLFPLSGAQNLTGVHLGGNPLLQIDLEPLRNTSLETLGIWSTKIERIDLQPLATTPELHDLYLHDNELVEISLEPLRSSKIHTLRLWGNKLQSLDLEPLGNCTELQMVMVWQNNISEIDLSPLGSWVEHVILDAGVTVTENPHNINVAFF